MDDIKILKQDIVVETRKLKAQWIVDIETEYQPKVDISMLTEEEQADLIVQKLKAPPVKRSTLEDEISAILVQQLKEEIDKEIMKSTWNLGNDD